MQHIINILLTSSNYKTGRQNIIKMVMLKKGMGPGNNTNKYEKSGSSN
jgi:hypothetical protein